MPHSQEEATSSPLAAALPKGLDEDAFRSAVSASGYPLQISAAATLKQRRFSLQEEFAFADPDEGARRTLDVIGTRWDPIYESDAGKSRFGTTVLVECKQSRHPLVLFESVSPPSLARFPQIVGYPRQEIKVSSTRPPSKTYVVPITTFLGSLDENFISAPSVAASLSRAVPNGKKVALSGEEVYRGITMPLVKAAHAVRKYWGGPQNPTKPSNFRSLVPIAVVDSPLIFVSQPTEEPTIEPRPWIRLAVRDPMSGKENPWEPLGIEIIDVVQRDFFGTYLDEHLLPFISTLQGRACEVHNHFLRGEATIEDLDWSSPLDQPLYQLLS